MLGAVMSYYLMHRGWMDNDVFRGDPYTMRSAWVWLIENAAWEPTQIRIDRYPVPLARGELSFSEAFLAKKWKWAKSRVHRYLEDLATWGMITRRNSPTRKSERDANRPQHIITICNYDTYQDAEKVLELRREPTLNRQRTDIEPKKNTGNTSKQEDSDSPDGESAPPFDPIKDLWDRGRAVLGNSKSAGSLMGKLRKQHGDAVVLQAIVAAEAELPSDAASFLIGCCNRAKVNGHHGDIPPTAADLRFRAGRQATFEACLRVEQRQREREAQIGYAGDDLG